MSLIFQHSGNFYGSKALCLVTSDLSVYPVSQELYVSYIFSCHHFEFVSNAIKTYNHFAVLN